MTFLSKVLARFSRLPRRLLKRKNVQESTHVEDGSIQKPPEDIHVETEERVCEVSSGEMEIFGEKLQPLFPNTPAEPLMIQVAPLHPATVEEERPPERRGTRKSKKERRETPSPVQNAWMETCNMQVTHPENDWLEDHIRTEKSKKKRKNDHLEQSTSPPIQVKLAWMETSNMQVSHAQTTKAEEDSEPETMVEILTVVKDNIKKERKIEYQDDIPSLATRKLAWMETSNSQVSHPQTTKAEEDSEPETTMVETLTVVKHDIKKERKIEYRDDIPPPAKRKLAWMETSNTQVTHPEERSQKRKENEQEKSITLIKSMEEENSPEEHETRDRKTQQAKTAPPTAKEKSVQMESDISSRPSHVKKTEPEFCFIYTMSELNAYEKKMKKKMKEERKQRQSATEPSLKDHLINKLTRFKKYN